MEDISFESLKPVLVQPWMLKSAKFIKNSEDRLYFFEKAFVYGALDEGYPPPRSEYIDEFLKDAIDTIRRSRHDYIEKATAIGMKGKEFGVQGKEYGVLGKEHGIKGKEYGALGGQYGHMGGRPRKGESDEERKARKADENIKRKEISDYIRGDAKIIEEIEEGSVSQMSINVLNDKFNNPLLVDSVLKYYIKNHIKDYKNHIKND